MKKLTKLLPLLLTLPLFAGCGSDSKTNPLPDNYKLVIKNMINDVLNPNNQPFYYDDINYNYQGINKEDEVIFTPSGYYEGISILLLNREFKATFKEKTYFIPLDLAPDKIATFFKLSDFNISLVS